MLSAVYPTRDTKRSQQLGPIHETIVDTITLDVVAWDSDSSESRRKIGSHSRQAAKRWVRDVLIRGCEGGVSLILRNRGHVAGAQPSGIKFDRASDWLALDCSRKKEREPPVFLA